MNITDMLIIDNGEKCPYCERIVTEKTDVLKHFIFDHPAEVEEALFKEENQ